MDSQVIGGFALSALVAVEILTPSIPLWLIISAAAFLGSTISVGWRVNKGFIKGWGAIMLTILSGFSCGALFGYNISLMAGYTGLEMALPTYLMSLFSSKVTEYMSTKFDVDTILKAIVDYILQRAKQFISKGK